MARAAPVRFEAPPGESNAGCIHFAQPEYGVSPGQAAAIYDGDRVLGGGWISETVPAELVAA
jgi:tRNA-specific 2-thiouridylase